MSVTHSLSEDTGPSFSLSPRKKIEDDDRNYTHCSIKAEYGLDLFLPLLVFKLAEVSHMQHHSLGDPTNKQVE